MAGGGGEAMDAVIDAKKWPSVIGPMDFLDWVKGKYYTLKHHEIDDDSKFGKRIER
jgi:hypothetical protein